MSTDNSLFGLLPALYRLRDAQVAQSQNLPQGPLQSLLMLIDEQFAIVAEDLNQRYDDLFIETCAPWVIPYIADLIGYQAVHGVAAAVASPRAEVANTVDFRRRKGTVLVLERLARDVTGWGAHATEFFVQLAVTQYTKHPRPGCLAVADVRTQRPGIFAGAFDLTPRAADVRRIAAGRGRYNIQNVGVFLWSLSPYGLTAVPATAIDGTGQSFRIDPLGIDRAIFTLPVTQGDESLVAAAPQNICDRLSREVLCQDLQTGASAQYYGVGKTFALFLNGNFISPYQIQVCNLSGADGHWNNMPGVASYYPVCVDPELGRIALASPLDPLPAAGAPTLQLQSSFTYGFNADLGGGDYGRSDNFTIQAENEVLPFPDTATTPRYTSLQDAINYALANLAGSGQAAVEITNCGTYAQTTAPALQVSIPAGVTLELRAAQGVRPTLLLNGEIAVTGGDNSVFVLNGIVVAYAAPTAGATLPKALLHASADGTNQLSELRLRDCTLVPGWALQATGGAQPAYVGLPALLAENAGVQVSVARSIVGSLRIGIGASAVLTDSLIDAGAPTAAAYSAADGQGGGGSITMQCCTVIGKLHATVFTLLSNSIVWAWLASGDAWAAALWSDRKQQGCIRFCFLPASSKGPPQFQSVTLSNGTSRPRFVSLQYGDPGYGKLQPTTDDAIRRGADDGGELGAFHFVLAPMRETDLRTRLAEYLPVGLEFGIFYQN